MKTTIGQIMSKDIISVGPEDNAVSAALLMEQHNVGSVPIVSGGQLKGILTDRDIVVRCVARHMDPEVVRTSEIMTDDIACVREDQPVSDAISLMASEQVRRLPVLSGEKLVGMVSFADVARRDTSPEVAEAISDISAACLDDIDYVRQYNPHA